MCITVKRLYNDPLMQQRQKDISVELNYLEADPIVRTGWMRDKLVQLTFLHYIVTSVHQTINNLTFINANDISVK